MDDRENRKSSWGRLKTFIGLVTLVFAVTLAVIVGNRLSDEALAVLAGAVCGVGAAIPTSLLIVAVSRWRNEENKQRVQMSTPQGAYPPVVVVAPPGGQQRPNAWNSLPPSLTAPVQRNFTVVGGVPADAEVMSYERYS
ncbi:MAG: hypothetical protein SWK90_02845 [Chloroflexota bacterium]|nr:hypothetical protein [Chloroflexota bacterium]